MSAYDIEAQRQAAIAQLKAKNKQIKAYAKNSSHNQNTQWKWFAPYCQAVRELYQATKLLKVYPEKDSKLCYALRYVKIEIMIERLEAGEDPRIILYEVVSDD